MPIEIRELIIRTEVRDDDRDHKKRLHAKRESSEQTLTADDLERLLSDRAER